MDTRIGQTLSQCPIVEKIGAGGKGEVYRTRPLSHPDVSAIYDVGPHEGSLFAVMEPLEGETPRRKLGRTCAR